MNKITKTEAIDALTDLWIDCLAYGEAQGNGTEGKSLEQYRIVAYNSWNVVEDLINTLLDNQRNE